MVIEVIAAVRDGKAAGVIGLEVGEAGVTDVTAVFVVEAKVALADEGIVDFAEGRSALLVGWKIEGGGVGGEDGERIGRRRRGGLF